MCIRDRAFPDTIQEVIFAPGQFSPVANGTIYRTPDEKSVIAAKPVSYTHLDVYKRQIISRAL